MSCFELIGEDGCTHYVPLMSVPPGYIMRDAVALTEFIVQALIEEITAGRSREASPEHRWSVDSLCLTLEQSDCQLALRVINGVLAGEGARSLWS